MNYYTHIINGQLKVGMEKPEKHKFGKSTRKGSAGKQYHKALKDWEESLMDVENAWLCGSEPPHWRIDFEFHSEKITPGQQVEIEKTGKGCRIIRMDNQ